MLRGLLGVAAGLLAAAVEGADLGGLLGFERSRATRHPKQVYENLLASITVFGGNMHVVERLWLMLFAGSDFLDVPT